MDVDRGRIGETGVHDGGGVSNGENVKAERKSSPERELKVKRKMKTPTQLETLEKTYAMEAYPSEALRAELSVNLGLSDRQLQMWFCHRRLKDRKTPTEKRQKKSASSSAVAVCASEGVLETVVNNPDGSNGHGSSLILFGNSDSQQQQLQRVVHKVGEAIRINTELLSNKRFYEPPLAISEQRAIRYVEAQLGEMLREDGPILGMEFDPLPPGAFGAPIVTSDQPKLLERPYDAQICEKLDAKTMKGASRALHEFQFLPEKPSAENDACEKMSTPQYHRSTVNSPNARLSLCSGRSFTHNSEQVQSGYSIGWMPIPNFSLLVQHGRPDINLSPTAGEAGLVPAVAPVLNANTDSPHLIQPVTGMDIQITTPDRPIVHDNDRLERKRKAEEAKLAKEVEAHEKKIRKELEKQDVLRRKREEQMRKEMERQVREQRKEEERLLRERQREEERYLREQKREMERREKFLHKECMRAEKKRLREEMRREKEAAKLKAANDRAAARRFAKDSIELIDDEMLELMELAALSRNLPSILSLDKDILQNLSSFKDKLPEFPPKYVPLKRPFQAQPWTDSEENVGNLLMVWRFLIAFADVLGLWPFTLDEFMQALHEFDSRLLGEIHIALLRSIIKDIEDVARTSATSTAANQSYAGTSAGGHPQIVEGAHAWGFDLLYWQNLLTPLTWPEVLRQLALSAGFRPNLKKCSTKSAGYLQEENEVDDCADNISNLRSGVAAENAVAIMQERGFSRPRRSRHRLTPGTVKFAAFHILSVEGSMGLSILEAADKIQRSGLRDLTTSKTPEASISAALSRDTKLFERTAPSTYCVRSPYRKDPADAEAIITAAREKIRLYQIGNADEETEDGDKDDVDRDGDSESDDPDVNVQKRKEGFHSGETPVSQYASDNRILTDAPGNSNSSVADECDSGELWIRGLTEGEYVELTIEERLNALVALISIANEGNTIRISLEERLEAANALKKQMWAEAQIDKRRTKDEHIPKLPCSTMAVERAEHNFASESGRSTPLRADIKNAIKLIDLNHQQNDENFCVEGTTAPEISVPECSVATDNLPLEQSINAAEKSRSDMKALIGQLADEVYVYRSLPLGQDRRRNRYWQFIASPSCGDPGSSRIFVELHNSSWRVIDSEEGFDCLLSSLDVRGIRESHLHSMLQNIERSFRDSARRSLLSEGSYVFPIKPKHDGNQKDRTGRRHEEFEAWMWKECLNSNVLSALKYGSQRHPRLLEICDVCCFLLSSEDGCCPSCSGKFFTEDSSSNLCLPPRIKFLKAQIATIESCIPSDAFNFAWSNDDRRLLGMNLIMASTAEELLQIITDLENHIKKEFLSANFTLTSEMLSAVSSANQVVSVLPWIPLTAAAVGLRLMELDASICYAPKQKVVLEEDNKTGPLSVQLQKSPLACSSDGYPQQDSSAFAVPVNNPTNSKRGRGRPRGRRTAKFQKEPTGLRGHQRGRLNCKKSGRRGRWNPVARVETAQQLKLTETVDQFQVAEIGSSSGRSEYDDNDDDDNYEVEDDAFCGSKSVQLADDEQNVQVYQDDDEEDEEEDDEYYVEGYLNEAGNGARYEQDEGSNQGSSSSTSSGYSY